MLEDGLGGGGAKDDGDDAPRAPAALAGEAGSRPLRGARCHSRARTARRSCFTRRSRDRWDAAPIGAVALVEARVARNLAAVRATAGRLAGAAGVVAASCRPVPASPSSGLDHWEKAGPLRGSRAPRVRGEGATRGMASETSSRALRMEATLFRERVRNEPSSPGRCPVQRPDRRRGPSRGNHALRFQYVDGAFIRTR